VSELITIRSSSWAGLFDCAHAWEWVHINGIMSPSSSLAHLGSSIHAGTALFDQAMIDYKPITFDEAVDKTVDHLRHPDYEVAEHEDAPMRDLEKLGIHITTRYCAEIGSKRRYAAVELSYEPMEIETGYGVIRLTGTTDRVRVAANGDKGISDLKSGKLAVLPDGTAKTGCHHIQLGIYTILGEWALGEELKAPAEIIGLQTTKTGRVGTAEITDVKTALLGNDDRPGLIEMAGKMLKTGLFPPNPRSQLCSKKYCAAYDICIYHN
jgi:hypothetical protein